MRRLTELYVKIAEPKGQTMTEYALILGAVVLLAAAAYEALGNTIVTSLSNSISHF